MSNLGSITAAAGTLRRLATAFPNLPAGLVYVQPGAVTVQVDSDADVDRWANCLGATADTLAASNGSDYLTHGRFGWGKDATHITAHHFTPTDAP